MFRQKPYISPKHHYVSTEKGHRTENYRGLNNHDLGHEINKIYLSQNDKSNKTGPWHTCNGPHFIKDYDETVCLRFKPNLNYHKPSKCLGKCHPNKQLSHNTFNNSNIVNGHKLNQYTKPNLQLFGSDQQTRPNG